MQFLGFRVQVLGVKVWTLKPPNIDAWKPKKSATLILILLFPYYPSIPLGPVVDILSQQWSTVEKKAHMLCHNNGALRPLEPWTLRLLKLQTLRVFVSLRVCGPAGTRVQGFLWI